MAFLPPPLGLSRRGTAAAAIAAARDHTPCAVPRSHAPPRMAAALRRNDAADDAPRIVDISDADVLDEPFDRFAPRLADEDFDSEGFDDDDDDLINGEDNDDGITVIDVPNPPRRKKMRRRMNALLEEIQIQPPPESVLTSDADDLPPIDEDDLAPAVRTAVAAADRRKADDIVALRVAKVTYVTSFVIIASAGNTPQIRAIANLIEEDLAKLHRIVPRRVEGVASSGWVLLDYGDMLVNVFSPEQRENYNLEKLWKRGEEMDVSDCLLGESEQEKGFRKSMDAPVDDWLDDQ